MKLCKDCEHFTEIMDGMTRCEKATSLQPLDLVYGKHRNTITAGGARYSEKLCGEVGVWFKERVAPCH